MRKTISLAAFVIFAFNSPMILAEDRIAHYEGKSAENIEQAQVNLSKYNSRMAKLLSKDNLDTEDIQKIHNITYTLENALAHLEKQLEQLQVNLEEIHLASERGDGDTISQLGSDYLLKSKQLFD